MAFAASLPLSAAASMPYTTGQVNQSGSISYHEKVSFPQPDSFLIGKDHAAAVAFLFDDFHVFSFGRVL